jgi:hypothetical protein
VQQQQQPLITPEAEALLADTSEFDYLTHIVFRMYENKQVGWDGHSSQYTVNYVVRRHCFQLSIPNTLLIVRFNVLGTCKCPSNTTQTHSTQCVD